MLEFLCDKTNLFLKWNQFIWGKTLVTQISHALRWCLILPLPPPAAHTHSTLYWMRNPRCWIFNQIFNQRLSAANNKPALADTQFQDTTEAIISTFRLRTQLQKQFCLKLSQSWRESVCVCPVNAAIPTCVGVRGIPDARVLASWSGSSSTV